MKIIKKPSIPWLVIIPVLVVACLLLLTGCQSQPIVGNDLRNECDHPIKPKKPYHDLDVALYLISQGKSIDTCKALLGK